MLFEFHRSISFKCFAKIRWNFRFKFTQESKLLAYVFERYPQLDKETQFSREKLLKIFPCFRFLLFSIVLDSNSLYYGCHNNNATRNAEHTGNLTEMKPEPDWRTFLPPRKIHARIPKPSSILMNSFFFSFRCSLNGNASKKLIKVEGWVASMSGKI